MASVAAVRERAIARAGWALESWLRRRGHSAPEAARGREATRDWAATRVSAITDRSRIVGGTHVVVHAVGRARLEPFERLVAGPDEVTVRLDHTAVSPGTERAQWLRLRDARTTLPHVPGFSGVGHVTHVGSVGAGCHEVGDAVAALRVPHTSLATMPAAWAIAVPPGADLRSASLVYLATIAAWGLERAGNVSGRHVAVIGAGTIGSLAHRLALLDAPSRTTVIASTTRARSAVIAAGADDFVTADDVGSVDADVVIEATGTADALRTAVGVVRPGGTIVQLGSPRGPTADVPLAELQERDLRLVGAHISSLVTAARQRGDDPDRALHDHAARYLDALVGGLDVSDLVGEALDPREATLAYRRLATDRLHHGHFDWTRVPDQDRLAERSLLDRTPMPWPRTPAIQAPPPRPSKPVDPLHLAVVGCGDIGLSNARAAHVADHCELALCVDVDPVLAESAGTTYDSAWSIDVADALDPERIDAVLLAVPHHLHEPLARRVIDAGIHVIVEKPLAHELESAASMVDAARRAGVTLTTCFPYRYESTIETARRLVVDHAIGTLRGFSVIFHADKAAAYWRGGFTGRSSSDWRTRHDRAGGGVLIMNLTHHLDTVLHLTGARFETVSAVADQVDAIEDRISLSITTTDGALGTVAGSASTPGAPDERFELWGEHGTIRLGADAAVFTERAVPGVATGVWTPFAAPEPVHERAIFLDRFAQQVRSGAEPDVRDVDGLAVQAVIDAAYTSARTGRPATVPPVHPER